MEKMRFTIREAIRQNWQTALFIIMVIAIMPVMLKKHDEEMSKKVFEGGFEILRVGECEYIKVIGGTFESDKLVHKGDCDNKNHSK